MAAPEPSESGPEAQAETPPLIEGEGDVFLKETRRYLTSEYPAKLERAVARLSPEDVWWRPTPAANSVGHLLRHLSGNVRQWVVHGIGEQPDVRDRASEFEAPTVPVEALMEDVWATLRDADAVLAQLSPGSLLEPRHIQGIRTSVLPALYHVVEHFSMHVGQVLWIVKARTGEDLGFYEIDADGRVTGTHW